MSLKRKLLYGLASVVFLALISFGTLLAITKKDNPGLLLGMDVEIISKQNAFYTDPTSGRMQQVTLTSLSKVDRDELLKKITERQNSGGRGAFFYPSGSDTILIELGPAKPLDYWASYITTFGKPPSKAYAVTSQGKTEFAMIPGAGGSAVVGARFSVPPAAPNKKGP
jgi:hypothetical protein